MDFSRMSEGECWQVVGVKSSTEEGIKTGLGLLKFYFINKSFLKTKWKQNILLRR